MSKSIVKSDAEKQAMLKKVNAMMADGLAFGLKRFLYYGAALYNIKSNELYKLDPDTPTWIAYLISINLDKSDAHRYVGIGAAISNHIAKSGADGSFILQKDLESLYSDRLDALRGLTFRQLADLSKRLDIFQNAMTGDEIQKLLPQKVESDADKMADVAKRSELADFNDHMRKVCEANGWVWSAKEKRCEHADGTPLTDEEYGRVTAPDTAMRVWTKVERDVAKSTHALRETIVEEMKPYLLYNGAVHNDAVRNRAWEIREQVRKENEAIIAMLDALIDGDEKRVKELRKHGIEE